MSTSNDHNDGADDDYKEEENVCEYFARCFPIFTIAHGRLGFIAPRNKYIYRYCLEFSRH